jgi:hypothetical protein
MDALRDSRQIKSWPKTHYSPSVIRMTERGLQVSFSWHARDLELVFQTGAASGRTGYNPAY